jgi:hypothetical protein
MRQAWLLILALATGNDRVGASSHAAALGRALVSTVYQAATTNPDVSLYDVGNGACADRVLAAEARAAAAEKRAIASEARAEAAETRAELAERQLLRSPTVDDLSSAVIRVLAEERRGVATRPKDQCRMPWRVLSAGCKRGVSESPPDGSLQCATNKKFPWRKRRKCSRRQPRCSQRLELASRQLVALRVEADEEGAARIACATSLRAATDASAACEGALEHSERNRSKLAEANDGLRTLLEMRAASGEEVANETLRVSTAGTLLTAALHGLLDQVSNRTSEVSTAIDAVVRALAQRCDECDERCDRRVAAKAALEALLDVAPLGDCAATVSRCKLLGINTEAAREALRVAVDVGGLHAVVYEGARRLDAAEEAHATREEADKELAHLISVQPLLMSISAANAAHDAAKSAGVNTTMLGNYSLKIDAAEKAQGARDDALKALKAATKPPALEMDVPAARAAYKAAEAAGVAAATLQTHETKIDAAEKAQGARDDAVKALKAATKPPALEMDVPVARAAYKAAEAAGKQGVATATATATAAATANQRCRRSTIVTPPHGSCWRRAPLPPRMPKRGDCSMRSCAALCLLLSATT